MPRLEVEVIIYSLRREGYMDESSAVLRKEVPEYYGRRYLNIARCSSMNAQRVDNKTRLSSTHIIIVPIAHYQCLQRMTCMLQ